MRQMHCDGCNRSEPIGTPKSDSIMQMVTLTLVSDGRSWAVDQEEKYEADLCDRCRKKLLHTFFRVPADIDNELPAFLSTPVSALDG
jgi:hypothetical protein